MGSFNVQCVASKMRITHYDEVVVFPLFKHHESFNNFKLDLNIKEELEKLSDNKKEYLIKHGGDFFTNPSEKFELNITREKVTHIYPGETWKIGLPIIAKYNDYGGFELEDKHVGQISTQLFIRLVKNYGISASKENYEYARLNFNPKNLSGATTDENADIKEILNVQQDSLLFVANDNSIEYKRNVNNYHQVSLAYMDKKVYDLMMDKFKLDREKLYKQIDEHIQYIAPYLEAGKNYFDFARANPDDKESKMNLYSQYKDLESKTQIRGLNSDYESSFQCYYRNTWFDFNNHMTMDKETKEMSWDPEKLTKYIELLKSKADAYIANSFMDNILSESWTPVKYTGQDMDNKDRIEFNKAVNKIAQERYNNAFGEDEPKPRKKKIK